MIAAAIPEDAVAGVVGVLVGTVTILAVQVIKLRERLARLEEHTWVSSPNDRDGG